MKWVNESNWILLRYNFIKELQTVYGKNEECTKLDASFLNNLNTGCQE